MVEDLPFPHSIDPSSDYADVGGHLIAAMFTGPNTSTALYA